MLGELSVVEQRYLAVREVLDSGATVTDVLLLELRRTQIRHAHMLPRATQSAADFADSCDSH